MLVFQTRPLEEDVEVTGSIEVVLWVSSSAVDTDFTAKLLDVYPPSEDYPDGYHLNLVDSILRARYRNGFERAELMQPGEVYRVRIPLPPISNLFKTGHRIRLDIASSNFPKFDVNPNTGEPWAGTPAPKAPGTACTWTVAAPPPWFYRSCLLSSPSNWRPCGVRIPTPGSTLIGPGHSMQTMTRNVTSGGVGDSTYWLQDWIPASAGMMEQGS